MARPGSISPFVTLKTALAHGWQQLVAPTADNLPEAIRNAKALFKPVTPETALSDRAALVAAAARLDAKLKSYGPTGDAWKKYLRWDALQGLVAGANPPEPDAVAAAEKWFFADQPGLELPEFSQVGHALRHYRESLVAAATADLQAQYESQLAALADDVAKYQAAADFAGAERIGRHIDWLATRHQAPLLLAAVRIFESKPNLHVQISEPLIALGIARPIHEQVQVNDNILGTSVSGSGQLVGDLGIKLVPDEKQAAFEIVLSGVTTTKTVGQNGPATIYATGTTRLNASARVEVDAGGIHWQPAQGGAQTSTRIDGVAAGGAMVQRIASQKVAEGKYQAERIAEQHAGARVRARLTSEVAGNLIKANQNFQEKFRNPLVRRGEFPSELKFSTSAETLFVRAVQADYRQIAAPTAPPGKSDGDALFVQLHESMVNNLAAGVLAGQTLHEEDVQKQVIRLRGSLPESLQSDDEREPWSITFADEEPVVFVIGDGELKITIKGKHYTSGEREFKAMNVSATYKVEKTDGGSRLTRQGDLQIFPPDFVEGKTTFNMQQTALRSILRKKFGKLFPAETINEGLELPGRWKAAGKLPLRQLTAKNGWLVLGWGMPNERTAAAVKEAGHGASNESWNQDRYDRVPIPPPLAEGGSDIALDPPSDEKVLKMLESAAPLQGAPSITGEIRPNIVRIVKEKVADYLDPPRVFPLVGLRSCTIAVTSALFFTPEIRAHGRWLTLRDEGPSEAVYLDKNHLHKVGKAENGELGAIGL